MLFKDILIKIGNTEEGSLDVIESIKNSDNHIRPIVTNNRDIYWCKSVEKYDQLPKNIPTKYGFAIDLDKSKNGETFIYIFENNKWANQSILLV